MSIEVGDVVRVVDGWDLKMHGDIGHIGRELAHLVRGVPKVEGPRALKPGDLVTVACEPLGWLIAVEKDGYRWALPPRLLEGCV